MPVQLILQKAWKIFWVMCNEKYRGKGIGHKMFEFLKTMKVEKNMDGIELQVNARNRAAYEMYKKYGFTEKSINMELLAR